MLAIQNPMLARLFQQIAVVDPSGSKYPYLTGGSYLVEVHRSFLKETRKGLAWITEMRVIESNNQQHAPDGMHTWFVKLGTADEQTMGLQNIKSFLLACFALDYANPSVKGHFDAAAPALMNAAASSANPLGGHVLRLNCFERANKTRPGSFTIHDWQPDAETPPLDVLAVVRAGSEAPPIELSPPAAPAALYAAPAPAALYGAGTLYGAPAPAVAWTYTPDGAHASSDGGRTWVQVRR